jgi:hypothetical protein
LEVKSTGRFYAAGLTPAAFFFAQAQVVGTLKIWLRKSGSDINRGSGRERCEQQQLLEDAAQLPQRDAEHADH